MNQNIFQELQEKKQRLLTFAHKAVEFGWIAKTKASATDKTIISLEEIVEKIEKDTLTIGVIGQMKCGKSTFLNSFVFEEDILPAATTPMTAALSVITYGEKERLVAEFYTADEWAEQQQQAARSLSDVANSLDESKVKAAKELVAKATKLGNSLDSYLGKTKEDEFSNLIEYVGADGKFVSITKAVTIYYPKDYLKGVEIVDTPGFNDPIVSREERTKEFLRKADVVLMLLYAGRPFDATDRDIIFQHVRQCGIGKVLIGINKYDIPYCSDVNPEDENQIKDYVKDEIRKACRACNDNTLVEILEEAEPIPLSAEMALLSRLPMSRITNSESLNFAWNRHCSNFGISTQQEMREWSRIDDLIKAIKEVINKEKTEILFSKPFNSVCAAGEKKRFSNESELHLIQNKIDLLSMPDSEVEEREENLAKAHRRISKKIDSLGEDIEANLNDSLRKGKNELEDTVAGVCDKANRIVDELKIFQGFDDIRPKIEQEFQRCDRTLKRIVDDIARSSKKVIKKCAEDFFDAIQEEMNKRFPDIKSKELVKSMENKVYFDIESNEQLSPTNTNSENGIGDYLFAFLKIRLGNALSHSEIKVKAKDWINRCEAEFNPKDYLDRILEQKDEVIASIKRMLMNELIEPLQEQIHELRSKIGEREQLLSQAKAEQARLQAEQANIEGQLKDIQLLKTTLS